MDSLAVRTASPAPSTSSSSVAAAGHQNGVNGINGNAINGSIVNGKARQRDAFPGVSFGPGVRVPLPPHSQQVAGSATTSYADDPNLNFNSRFNTLAMQDDAIVAAGPSTPSTSTASAGVSRYQTPPPPQPVAAAATAPAAESSDTDLLEHIVSCHFGCQMTLLCPLGLRVNLLMTIVLICSSTSSLFSIKKASLGALVYLCITYCLDHPADSNVNHVIRMNCVLCC